MKRLLVLLVLVAVAFYAIAEDADEPLAELVKEAAGLLYEKATTPIGDITLGQLELISQSISLAAQKMQFVHHSRKASLILPGIGQFMNGDVIGGILFVLADLATVVGTAVGAYFLLPEDLRFNNIDYLGTGLGSLRDTWDNHSIMDLLPSIGVSTGGLIVGATLRCFASLHAGKLARTNISEKKITFEPEEPSALAWLFLTWFTEEVKY